MQPTRLSVTVKPKSRTASIERTGERSFTVRVTASPHEGKANEAVIRAIADYFDVPKSTVVIVSGEGSRTKIIDVGV